MVKAARQHLGQLAQQVHQGCAQQEPPMAQVNAAVHLKKRLAVAIAEAYSHRLVVGLSCITQGLGQELASLCRNMPPKSTAAVESTSKRVHRSCRTCSRALDTSKISKFLSQVTVRGEMLNGFASCCPPQCARAQWSPLSSSDRMPSTFCCSRRSESTSAWRGGAISVAAHHRRAPDTAPPSRGG